MQRAEVDGQPGYGASCMKREPSRTRFDNDQIQVSRSPIVLMCVHGNRECLFLGKGIMNQVTGVVRVFAVALGLVALVSGGMSQQVPAERWQGGLSFVSGGIGQDEAALFKKLAGTYPLAVEFIRHAEPKDEYEADVAVTIRSGDGKTVLDVQSQGPFLLVNLPDGTYTVQAQKDGPPIQRTVRIKGERHQRVVFEWKP